MRFTFVPLTCLALALIASPVMAKDKKPAKQMDPQAMMEVYQKLATPGEPHKQFESLAGSWTTQTKEWMEPGKPPTEASGSADMKMLLGGRDLQQEFTREMMGQPYTGMRITGYGNLHKKHVSIWLDTMGTAPFMMESTGSADGKTITLKGQHAEPSGGHMTHCAVWKIVDSNTQTFDMWGTEHGGKDTKVLEITYSRKQ